jgi:transposase
MNPSTVRNKATRQAAMRQAVAARHERDISSVVAVVVAADVDGITSVDIANRLGRGYDTVIRWIRAAVKQGRIEMAGHASSAVYGPAGTRAEWARKRLLMRRKQNTERSRQRREEQTERQLNAPFVHRVIPAGSRPPPVTTAPRSVFEVAA